MHSLFSWISRIWSPFGYIKSETMSIISFDTNVTKISVTPKEMTLPSFLKYVCQLIKEAEE